MTFIISPKLDTIKIFINGIVKWDFFSHKKLGKCTLMNEQNKFFGLGPLLGLFLPFLFLSADQ